jgi:hypothetical protein
MPSTISDPQFKGAVLDSTLTTAHLVAAAGTRVKITHATISNGATAGTVTISRFDKSANSGTGVVYELLNAMPIAANNATTGNIPPLEFTEWYLEAEDELRGGATTTTDAKLSLDYYVITL